MSVLDRTQQALKQVRQVQALRDKATDKNRANREAQASTTDPQARFMKMGDGRVRPAYNIQLRTMGDRFAQGVMIVAVRVVQQGSDHGSLLPMQAQLESRLGPGVWPPLLVDNQHVTVSEVEAFEARGLALLGGVTASQKESGSHSAVMAQWKTRMQAPENRQLYRLRKALAERPSAWIENKVGLRQLPVRGVAAVLNLAVVVTLAFNIESVGGKMLARLTSNPALAGPLHRDAPLRSVRIHSASEKKASLTDSFLEEKGRGLRFHASV